MDSNRYILLLFVIVCMGELVLGNLYHSLHHYETLHINDVKHSIVKRSVENPSQQIKKIELSTQGREFKIFMSPNRNIFAAGFAAYTLDNSGQKKRVAVNPHDYYKGHVYGESGSDVYAHFEDDALHAEITTEHEKYIIEPSWRHLPHSHNYTMISYKASDMKLPHLKLPDGQNFCQFIHPDVNETEIKLEEEKHHRQRHHHRPNDGPTLRREKRAFTPSKRICPLLLVADYRFFNNMGKKNLIHTINYLIGLITRVDAIYKRTDFDASYKKMGFEIKEVMVHQVPTAGYHYNMAKDKWPTKEFLEAFSSMEGLYRNFCLAHMFTYQPFDGGVLGLAYIGSRRKYSVGGICTRPYYKSGRTLSLNTGWSSSQNRYKNRILTQEADLVTAHEFGHNWGSEHDPDTSECSPSSFNNGKFIMYPYSVSGYDKNNKYFSPCSRRAIAAVLTAKSDLCFAMPSPGFCGNHLVEPGEQCDAGSAGQIGTDHCCTAECRLKPGAICSYANSVCCNQMCTYESSQKKCSGETDILDVACEKASSCTGNSAVCPPPLPKDDKTPCFNNGTCKGGICQPFCYSINKLPCVCDEVAESCKWCCRVDEKSKCIPHILSNGSQWSLPDGMPCVQGYCNAGKCEKVVQDMVERFFKIIENLTPDLFVKFMRDNMVGTVIVFSMIIWIPASCTISHFDRKRRQKEREIRDWHSGKNRELIFEKDKIKVKDGGLKSRRNLAGSVVRMQPLQRSAGVPYARGTHV
ncbi:ADAM 17-like protease [Tubulanus polymorphus]|uniref:ADAM 17-like protease n=1 Tax=Tubulanus polymorphus TaxID=672921 RepID=UPI003DA400DF